VFFVASKLARPALLMAIKSRRFMQIYPSMNVIQENDTVAPRNLG
jgi:hypothetical protein